VQQKLFKHRRPARRKAVAAVQHRVNWSPVALGLESQLDRPRHADLIQPRVGAVGVQTVRQRLRGAGQDAKSSKPIGKTKIEEHNCIRGRGLLQKLPRNETGEVQRCEEMLAYGPTNLKVGLTPDEARAAKVRRSYWHVLKAVERVFRALAPEPYPLESSGYVP